MFESGTMKLIRSNEEMNHIMKTVKSFEEAGLLIKRVSKKIKNEAKEQKGGFLIMLLGTLSANLLTNLLGGKGAEQVNAQLQQTRIFNATSYFN